MHCKLIFHRTATSFQVALEQRCQQEEEGAEDQEGREEGLEVVPTR